MIHSDNGGRFHTCRSFLPCSSLIKSARIHKDVYRRIRQVVTEAKNQRSLENELPSHTERWLCRMIAKVCGRVIWRNLQCSVCVVPVLSAILLSWVLMI